MHIKLPGAPYQTMLKAGLKDLIKQDVTARIWARDHTVWSPEPDEITNRLGWLDIAARMKTEIPRIKELAHGIWSDGLTELYLLGMGGSSLAPELFSRTFPAPEINLRVIDTTHPDYLEDVMDRLDPGRSLFIVASKSGSTVETLSLFKAFYRHLSGGGGIQRPGDHFVAVTDPGSHLVDLAHRYQFRALFENDPEIGGRYSALSFFGMVPAGLLGLDLEDLLDRAQEMSERCRLDPADGFNPGLELGSALGVFAVNGRDKATFFSPAALASFPDWAEQLLAESTGKDGQGILPVVGTGPGAPDLYSSDRLFIDFTLGEDRPWQKQVDELKAAGHPVITIALEDRAELGGQFFLWEMAVAAAGAHLGINPFDQPNVESAKQRAREMMDRYRETGSLPEAELSAADPEALKQFIREHREAESYLAVQAYLPPRPDVRSALARLQTALRDRHQLPVTVGLGPRYLHSTGQLHKGDSGRGLFLQLVDNPAADLPIPDRPEGTASEISFGTLIRAQALGDASALREAGRPVHQINLARDGLGGLNVLAG